MIIPIATEDIRNTYLQIWATRMLYNAYLPFNYSYILDTHVFPCYSDSYSSIFSLFCKSEVDISASCREGDRLFISGGAVLSKWGERSHSFWRYVFSYMMGSCKVCDDQTAMMYSLPRFNQSMLSFKWLSSNWFWASHAIMESGRFLGSASCYRSSVITTGPIKWIHGDASQCALMNGKNNEYVLKKRVYYLRGSCNVTTSGPSVVFSSDELKRIVYPYNSTTLDWKRNLDSYSLFWPLFCVCLKKSNASCTNDTSPNQT